LCGEERKGEDRCAADRGYAREARDFGGDDLSADRAEGAEGKPRFLPSEVDGMSGASGGSFRQLPRKICLPEVSGLPSFPLPDDDSRNFFLEESFLTI